MRFKPKHKYGAIACERDGRKFPSKLERSVYDRLKLLQKAGEIRFFLMQVPFHLPQGKHVVDFCVFTDEHVIFLESKGRDTPLGKLKRETTENLYDIDIHVVKNALEIDKHLDLPSA